MADPGFFLWGRQSLNPNAERQHPLWRLDMGLETIFKHHGKHHFVWMLDLQLWIYDIHYEHQPWSGTDPGFPVEGGCQPSMGRCQHASFPKNFVKLRKVWSVGGGHAPGALPLNPPLLMLTQTLCVNRPLGDICLGKWLQIAGIALCLISYLVL